MMINLHLSEINISNLNMIISQTHLWNYLNSTLFVKGENLNLDQMPQYK
jgi:hypothetical protein